MTFSCSVWVLLSVFAAVISADGVDTESKIPKINWGKYVPKGVNYGKYVPKGVNYGKYVPKGVNYGKYVPKGVNYGKYVPKGVNYGKYVPKGVKYEKGTSWNQWLPQSMTSSPSYGGYSGYGTSYNYGGYDWTKWLPSTYTTDYEEDQSWMKWIPTSVVSATSSDYPAWWDYMVDGMSGNIMNDAPGYILYDASGNQVCRVRYEYICNYSSETEVEITNFTGEQFKGLQFPCKSRNLSISVNSGLLPNRLDVVWKGFSD